MATGAGAEPAAALLLMGLANAINSTSSDLTTDPAPVPRTLWLQNLAIGIEIFAAVLSVTICLMRAYIRIVTRNLGWDDYWIFGAGLLCIAQTPISIIYIKWTYIGIHNAEIPPHDTVAAGLIAYVNGLIYNPILSMVKVSILLFLLRLAGTRPAVRFTIWVLMVFTICLMIAIFFCVIFVCSPVAYNWDRSIEGGTCFDKKPFTMWTGAVTIFTDLLTLALPFWIFLGLRMPRRVKVALLGVFALGFIVTAVGAVRLYFLYRNNYVPKEEDSNFSIGFVTNALETNLAVIAASGPALWPLARRWFPRAFDNLGLTRGYQGDIPDIEMTAKEVSGGSSSRKSKRRGSFGLGLLGGGGGRRSQGTGARSVRSGRGGGAGIHTNHSIGGSSFVPTTKNMRGDGARGHTEIRHYTPNESEEEIMAYNGIMRTTDYTVTHDEEGRRLRSSEAESGWYGHRNKPLVGVGGTRSDPALRSSMGSI